MYIPCSSNIYFIIPCSAQNVLEIVHQKVHNKCIARAGKAGIFFMINYLFTRNEDTKSPYISVRHNKNGTFTLVPRTIFCKSCIIPEEFLKSTDTFRRIRSRFPEVIAYFSEAEKEASDFKIDDFSRTSMDEIDEMLNPEKHSAEAVNSTDSTDLTEPVSATDDAEKTEEEQKTSLEEKNVRTEASSQEQKTEGKADLSNFVKDSDLPFETDSSFIPPELPEDYYRSFDPDPEESLAEFIEEHKKMYPHTQYLGEIAPGYWLEKDAEKDDDGDYILIKSPTADQRFYYEAVVEDIKQEKMDSMKVWYRVSFLAHTIHGDVGFTGIIYLPTEQYKNNISSRIYEGPKRLVASCGVTAVNGNWRDAMFECIGKTCRCNIHRFNSQKNVLGYIETQEEASRRRSLYEKKEEKSSTASMFDLLTASDRFLSESEDEDSDDLAKAKVEFGPDETEEIEEISQKEKNKMETEKIIAAVAEFKKRESDFIRNSGILKYYAIQQLSKKLIDEISFSFFENFSPSNINDLKQQGNYAKKLVETNKLAKKRVEAELDAMRILRSICNVEVKEKMRKIDDAVSERTFLKDGISFNFEKEINQLCKFVNS